MRTTVRREHAHDDVPLTALPRPGRRRLAALAAAALLMGLVAEVGVVPGSTTAAFGAQPVADDACVPILPDDCTPPDPVPPEPPAPVPVPPKTTQKPTKAASPAPSVAAPKKHRKHRRNQSTPAQTPAPTPSAVTSAAVVAFAPATLRSSKKAARSRPKPKMFIPPVTAPSASSGATPEATVQEAFKPVSAQPRTGHGLLWFAVADLGAIALLVGGSLWRRRRLGPQW